MLKKYKLINEFPNSEKVGSIIELPEEVANLYPYLYANFKFTSDDDVDIYEGEITWAVDKKTLKIIGEGEYEGDNKQEWYYFKHKKSISLVVSPQDIRKIMDNIKYVLKEPINTMSELEISLIQVNIKNYEVIIQKKYV
jgi:hypothetical protein